MSCMTTKIIPVSIPDAIVKTYDANGNKDQLFINSNRWMISVFKDAKSVIQYSDKEAGTLIGKYLLHHHPGYTSAYFSQPEINSYAIIEITVKEGKARISITPESWNNMQSSDVNGKIKDSYSREQALTDIDALCENYYKALQTEAIAF